MRIHTKILWSAKKPVALLLTLALAAAYIISPAAGLTAVYAESSGNDSALSAGIPIVITAQPSDVTVREGDMANFGVEATGTDLKYQWYFRKTGDRKWSVWEGKTAAQITEAAESSWDMMRVYCRITDATGSTLSSDSAVVRIAKPIEISAHPGNISVKPGERMQFTVSALGTGQLSYQWYFQKADMSEGAVWSGHTTAIASAYADESCNLMRVWCEITDEAGSTARSQAATVTLKQALSIVQQPENVTVKVNKPVGISLSAKGTGKISYQWYYKKQGANSWSEWSSQTSPEITANADSAWNMMQVYCKSFIHLSDLGLTDLINKYNR